MNDPKAAAAYHPGDAHVVRPDLNALIAELEEVVILGDDPSGKELARRAMDALAAERARADQAAQRIADAPHSVTCLLMRAGSRAVHMCTCWKSAAPTTEQ